ncbi:beta-defensin 108B [Diceros bicornis minor]|uniref:beta-defensin 108B n=1 Tax=Diceros bicornis minor TaxID=77932 RepID=UPI0026ED7DA2|nr:beta-defensin 108B [Diceros bicornis minor]
MVPASKKLTQWQRNSSRSKVGWGNNTMVECKKYQNKARGKFKEVCERPNDSCQEFCIESEIHVGRCLNGRPCFLPTGNQPRIEPTAPGES